MNELVEQRWQDFEAAGERVVRQNLSTRIYTEETQRMAREWLEHRSRLESSASQAEQITIARDAKDAARAAAAAAREAANAAQRQARMAIAANIIAIIALGIAIASIIMPLMK